MTNQGDYKHTYTEKEQSFLTHEFLHSDYLSSNSMATVKFFLIKLYNSKQKKQKPLIELPRDRCAWQSHIIPSSSWHSSAKWKIPSEITSRQIHIGVWSWEALSEQCGKDKKLQLFFRKHQPVPGPWQIWGF